MIREAISVLLLSVVYCDVAYRYSETLDPERRFVMEWDVDYAKEIVNFKLTVALSSKEWFAFGFSDHGELTNADLLVVWTDPNETRFFKDARTDEAAIIHIDDHQDFRLVDSCARDGVHTVRFYRKFNTCHGDYAFDRGTTHVLHVIGQGRPDTVENIDLRGLSSGVRLLQLLKADINIDVPPDAFTIDVVVPSIVIPNTTDTYWRLITKLPPMPKKLYIIRYEAIRTNPEFIHHIGFIRCYVPEGQTMPYYSGRRSEYRRTSDHVASQNGCFDPIVPLGEGEKRVIFPNDTGIPIGGSKSPIYVSLEIHYHNAKRVSGVVDRSGARLIVTPTPRRHEAAIMDLTSTSTHEQAIPPGQREFPLRSSCTAECTRKGIGPQGIWIFGYMVHNHLTGRRTYLQHIRNGKQLPDILRDDHYTPLFQEFRLLPAPVHVLPGDVLTLYLIGNTVERKRVMVTGLLYGNIMFAAQLHFYPPIKLSSCRTWIGEKALERFFATMRRLGGDPTSPAKGAKANYESIRWTPLKAYIYYLFVTHSPISQRCLNTHRKELLPNERTTPRPTIKYPLKITDPCKVTKD